MKKCRECGAELPSKNYTDGQRKVAEMNLKHYPKLLEKEGEYMTEAEKKPLERIIYESHLVLNGEYSFEEALCEKCKEKYKQPFIPFKHKEKMSREELERIKERGEKDSLLRGIESIIKKYR